MNKEDCIGEISEALSALGVEGGDTILVHSSFKSLGEVSGGIETLIQGLLHAIGETSTLLMPALSWNLRPPEVFNVRSTAVNVGAVPEYFRNRPGTIRSVHPTHSVCGFGVKARELLKNHALDNTPCGKNSPFLKITEIPAKIIMLGCGLKANTTMHALEELIQHPRFLGKYFEFTITDLDGRTYKKKYRTHDFNGFEQRYDKVLELNHDSFMRRGKVLEAETFVIKTQELKNAVFEKLQKDPLFFVSSFQ